MQTKQTDIIKAVKPADIKHAMLAKRKNSANTRIFEEFDFDPLEAAVKICKGDFSVAPHPFLDFFIAQLLAWEDRIKNNDPITKEDIEKFRNKGQASLTKYYIPPKTRAGFIFELLKYTYPQLKASAHAHFNVDDASSPKARLTKKDMQEALNIFNQQFSSEIDE